MQHALVTLALCALSLGCGCGGPSPFGGYGGEGEGGGSFSATPPAGVAGNAACASGAWWVGGDDGSSRMRPGGDCIGCHNGGEGPNYAMAGTVMGAVNDTDDCQGKTGVTVRITDRAGQIHEATTNSAGNFSLDAIVSTPYTVQLILNGKTRAMLTPQTDGDCMHCHTAHGQNGAPGRIVFPQ